MDTDSPSHLAVVLDIPPAFLPHLLVFLHAHLAENPANSLAVFAAFPAAAHLLYASTDSLHPPVSNAYSPFAALDHAVRDAFHALLDRPPSTEPPALVPAIAKALCRGLPPLCPPFSSHFSPKTSTASSSAATLPSPASSSSPSPPISPPLTSLS